MHRHSNSWGVRAAILLAIAGSQLQYSDPTRSAQLNGQESPSLTIQKAPDSLKLIPTEPDFLLNVHNFDDPLCLQWTNGCEACRRQGNGVTCSDPDPTCKPYYTICTEANFSSV